MLPCVILAGGLGTRMRPATNVVPKALLTVASKPFVDWQLQLLVSQGIDRALFCIGYRGDLLREHVGDGARWGMQVSWADERENLRGTAGALRLALDEGHLPEHFFLLYGDSYLPIDMRAVEEAWARSGSKALMTVLRNMDRWDVSNALYEDGRVLLYDKRDLLGRRGEMQWIDYGLSVLGRDVVRTHVPAGACADLADIMHQLSLAGELAGFEASERFYEAGSPAGLRDLEAHLLRPR